MHDSSVRIIAAGTTFKMTGLIHEEKSMRMWGPQATKRYVSPSCDYKARQAVRAKEEYEARIAVEPMMAMEKAKLKVEAKQQQASS